MLITEVVVLEGRLLSSQSEQFKMLLKSSDWLDKSQPSKKATSCLDMKTGYLYYCITFDSTKYVLVFCL